MSTIYRYKKVSDEYTTYQPIGEGITELCTLGDGYTYFSCESLSDSQPEQISIEAVTLTDETKEQIKSASPHVQLIERRKLDMIRAKYSAEDEMYFARISVGAISGVYTLLPHEPALIAQYQADIESIRQWGWAEKAKLGL